VLTSRFEGLRDKGVNYGRLEGSSDVCARGDLLGWRSRCEGITSSNVVEHSSL
jgi:hypothetical protein